MELALATVALACGVGLAFLGSATVTSDGSADLRIKIALGTTAVLMLVFAQRGWVRRAPGLERGVYVVVALLGIAAFSNLGVFRHADHWGCLNRAELFHYQLGARFFPELGHDGLYVASLAAQRQSHPARPMDPVIRDLRTNQLMLARDALPHAREVRARFTRERWKTFVADHARYLEALRPAEMEQLRRDHGYNPTPAWTFVGRLFGARVPSTTAGLGFLASLDPILLAIAFAAVWRTFGARAACLGVAILGLGHGWRSLYTGAFLRLDWLAAVVCGLCLLERRRWATAGAFFGYATAVRIFPVLFLAGPGLLAAKALLRGERPTWAFRLAAGFALTVALGIAAGGLAGRGLGAWWESVANLQHHRGLWPPNRVSIDNVIVNVPYLYDHFVTRGSPPEPELRTVPQILRTKHTRWLEGAAIKGGWLLLLGAAMWRATPASAAVLGMGVIFVLTPLGAYYWVMLLTIPLRRETPATLAVLLLCLALYLFQWRHPEPRLMEIRFALMSLGLAALLLGWFLPEALRTLRPSRNAAA